MALRGAVIGVGYLGNFHAQKYKSLPEVELVGVCDAFKEQAEKIGQNLGIPAYHNPQDLIGKVDVVTIAASTKSHYELAKLFLSHGVHVNVEKPITETSEQAKELIELAHKKNLVLSVGHIERFNPSLRELKKRLKNAESFELIRHAPYKSRGADVSVLHDLMIHDIDMMFWLTGSDVASFQVSTQTIVSKEPDAAQAHFLMKNGMRVFISVSRAAPAIERRVKAYEKNQAYYVDSGSGVIEFITGNGQESKVERIEVAKQDALQMETSEFFNAVLQKRSPAVSGVDGLRALQLVEDLLRAIHGS